jgi:hypothetical protein
VRRFKIFLVGDFPSPGVRVASAATRVSDLLPPAPGGLAPSRKVLLRCASGDTILVDLARFRLLGDLSTNSTLREAARS